MPGAADAHGAQVAHTGGADLPQVLHQRARGAHQGAVPGLEAEALQRLDREDAQQLVGAHVRLEHPVVAVRADRRALNAIRAERFRSESRASAAAGARRPPDGPAPPRAPRAGHALRRHLSGGHVQGRHAPGAAPSGTRRRPGSCSGRSESSASASTVPGVTVSRDLAAHDPLGQRRILHLVADGDPPPQLHQAGQVVVQGLGRHARPAAPGPRRRCCAR